MLTGLLRSITRSIIASLIILFGITSIGVTNLLSTQSIIHIDNPNNLYISEIFSVTVSAELLESTTFATPEASQTEAKESASWVKGLNAFIAFISMLYVPLSIFGGWLLSSEWTYGDLIGIRPIFHHLWVFVSNFVYVAFAGVLVFVAIANIFGQSDSYAIKKMLPRFIVGVIMVPLTWFAVSATLSVTNYATGMVLGLPADTITAVGGGPASEFKVEYPTHCTFDFTGVGGNTEVWKCDEGKNESKKLSEILTNSSNGAYGILPYYAYNVFEFGDLTKFQKQVTDAGAGGESVDGLSKGALIFTTLAKIGIQLTLKVVFFVVFMVILIMLVFVMMLRMIRMWFYIIFSPLFALRFFLADKVDKENVLAKFSFTEFLSLAMVPVFVAGALGFGFMFLMVFKQTVSTGKLDSEIVTDKKTPDSAAKTDGFYIFGVTEIEVKILSGKTKENKDDTVKLTKDTLAQLLSSLMTPILGIIILWMAVLAAAKSSTITKEAVGGFESAGKIVGDVAKKVPGMMPIPGSGAFTKNGKALNINQAANIGKILEEIKGEKATADMNALNAAFGRDKSIADQVAAINNAKTRKQAVEITVSANGDKDINAQAASSFAQNNTIALGQKFNITLDRNNLNTAQGVVDSWGQIADKMVNDTAFMSSLTQTQQGAIRTFKGSKRLADLISMQKALNSVNNTSIGELVGNGTYANNKLKFDYKPDPNIPTQKSSGDIDIINTDDDAAIKTKIQSAAPELKDADINKLIQKVRGLTPAPNNNPPPTP